MPVQPRQRVRRLPHELLRLAGRGSGGRSRRRRRRVVRRGLRGGRGGRRSHGQREGLLRQVARSVDDVDGHGELARTRGGAGDGARGGVDLHPRGGVDQRVAQRLGLVGGSHLEAERLADGGALGADGRDCRPVAVRGLRDGDGGHRGSVVLSHGQHLSFAESSIRRHLESGGEVAFSISGGGDRGIAKGDGHRLVSAPAGAGEGQLPAGRNSGRVCGQRRVGQRIRSRRVNAADAELAGLCPSLAGSRGAGGDELDVAGRHRLVEGHNLRLGVLLERAVGHRGVGGVCGFRVLGLTQLGSGGRDPRAASGDLDLVVTDLAVADCGIVRRATVSLRPRRVDEGLELGVLTQIQHDVVRVGGVGAAPLGVPERRRVAVDSGGDEAVGGSFAGDLGAVPGRHGGDRDGGRIDQLDADGGRDLSLGSHQADPQRALVALVGRADSERRGAVTLGGHLADGGNLPTFGGVDEDLSAGGGAGVPNGDGAVGGVLERCRSSGHGQLGVAGDRVGAISSGVELDDAVSAGRGDQGASGITDGDRSRCQRGLDLHRAGVAGGDADFFRCTGAPGGTHGDIVPGLDAVERAVSPGSRDGGKHADQAGIVGHEHLVDAGGGAEVAVDLEGRVRIPEVGVGGVGDDVAHHLVGAITVEQLGPEVDLPSHRPAGTAVAAVFQRFAGGLSQIRGGVDGDVSARPQRVQVRDVAVADLAEVIGVLPLAEHPGVRGDLQAVVGVGQRGLDLCHLGVETEDLGRLDGGLEQLGGDLLGHGRAGGEVAVLGGVGRVGDQAAVAGILNEVLRPEVRGLLQHGVGLVAEEVFVSGVEVLPPEGLRQPGVGIREPEGGGPVEHAGEAPRGGLVHDHPGVVVAEDVLRRGLACAHQRGDVVEVGVVGLRHVAGESRPVVHLDVDVGVVVSGPRRIVAFVPHALQVGCAEHAVTRRRDQQVAAVLVVHGLQRAVLV